MGKTSMMLFAVIATLSLLVLQGNAGVPKTQTNATKKLDNIFEELVKISRMVDVQVPPYDPSKPPADNLAMTPEQQSPQVLNNTQPQPQLSQRPPYYYVKYDEKWKKCCKLEKAKECCMKKAQNLPLYNLGTGMYYFHNDMNTAKNWYDALHFCRAHGMELVSIETEQENNILKSYIQWFLSMAGGQPDYYSFYWTALNDLGQEGYFTWSGTGLPASYFTWHNSGQPDGGVWENCGEIWQTAPGVILWNERSCLQWRGRFICEMPKICYDIISASYE